MLRNEIIAYTAGLIDGEGSIGLATRKKRYVTPTLQVSNTNRDLIAWIVVNWGGNVYLAKEKRLNRKALYLWSMAGRKAINVIKSVRPFLQVKDKQADIVISLYDSRNHKQDILGRISPPKYRLTEEQLQENKVAIEAIRKLNFRGVSV